MSGRASAILTAEALLDSNVLVAILAEAHDHHHASLAIRDPRPRLAVCAHSYAEVYSPDPVLASSLSGAWVCSATISAPQASKARDAPAAIDSVKPSIDVWLRQTEWT